MAHMKSQRAAGSKTVELLETFASAPRTEILDLLSKEPYSVEEIAEKVGLKPISVRFHLRKLLRLNLVEETKQRGSLGRPRYLYRATQKHFEVAFPPRSYEHLASVLLRALQANPDQSQVSNSLRKVGVEMGSELGRGLRDKAGVNAWDGPALKKHLVEGLLVDFGTRPETVECTDKSILYRLSNCPFKELAIKYPQAICEELDDTINISLMKELDKNLDWRKLRCIGHGDDYCEYLATRRITRHQ
jgi:predicted ArsR family transcriptional regulator